MSSNLISSFRHLENRAMRRLVAQRQTKSKYQRHSKSLTPSRKGTKNVSRFSLRSLCVSASLRESFCFFAFSLLRLFSILSLHLFTLSCLSTPFLLFTPAFAQEEADTTNPVRHFDPRREIEALRDEHSKTYAGDDGYFYKMVSATPRHYRTPEGEFREIKPYFVPIPGRAADFAVTEGPYRCAIRKTGAKKAAIRFEMNTGQFFEIAPLAMGYFDPASKRVALLDSARFEQPIVKEELLSFLEIFPGVDAQYRYQVDRFKEEMRLRPSFRDRLPDPKDYGMKADRAHVVFLSKVVLDTTLSAFAKNTKISRGRMKGGFSRLEYEGKDRIDFKNPHGKALFHLPADIAFHGAGRLAAERDTLLRSFFPNGDDLIMMTGLSYQWLMKQPLRPIIIDPQWVVAGASSVTEASLRNGFTQVIDVSAIFYIAGSNIEFFRSLLRFNLSGLTLPDSGRIVAATCYIYYNGNFVGLGNYTRPIQVHELLQDWDKAQANWYQRKTGIDWSVAGVGLNNLDANAVPEVTWEIPASTPINTWMSFPLTKLAKKWQANPSQNYGILLFAVNEDDFIDGEARAFNSSGYTNPPQLIIKYQYGEIARYTYNGDGSLASAQLGSDVVAGAYTYNDSGLVKKIEFTSGANTIFKEEITQYDAVGNIKKIKTTSPLGADVSTYTYDSIGRVDSANSSAYNDMGFRYDRNGNLTKKFVDGALYSYGYTNPKTNNRLLSFNNTNLTYDAIGNVIAYGNKTMTYDRRRQVESVMGPVSEYYDYSADNWRLKKTEGLVRRGTGTNVDDWRLDVTGTIENVTPVAGSTMYRLEVTINGVTGNHFTASNVKIATGLSIPVTPSSFLAYSIQAKQSGNMRATIQIRCSDGTTASWNMDLYDQNGVNNKWNTDLDSRYVGQWYNRVVSFGAAGDLAGKTISEVTFHPDDSPDITTGVPTTFVFYADEIRIDGLDIGEVNGNTGVTTPGYYLEDFNDTNLSDGRPTNWYRDVPANWNATGGTLNGTTFNETIISNPDFKFSNFTAEYDVKVTAFQQADRWAAFGFRRNTPQDGYANSGYTLFYRQNGQIYLFRDWNGLVTVETYKDLSTWRHVKIEVLAESVNGQPGVRIKVYVDGILFINFTEASPPYTTGYIAFYSFDVNPKFDNLTISSFGEQQRTYYIYSGEVPIAEYDANGQLVTKINPDGTMPYYLTDHPWPA